MDILSQCFSGNIIIYIGLISFFGYGCLDLNVPGCMTIDDITIKCKDYIPRHLNPNVRRVILGDFSGSLYLNESTFLGDGWDKIDNLTISHTCQITTCVTKIQSNTFNNLHSLTSLHIHVTGQNLTTNIFQPLTKLQILDLTNCTYLRNDEFVAIIESPDCLPALEKLILVRASVNSGLELTDDNFKSLMHRPIKYLDFSYAFLEKFNISSLSAYCDQLEYLFFHGTKFFSMQNPESSLEKNQCRHLKVVDFSNVDVDKNLYCFDPGTHDVHGLTVNFLQMTWMAHIQTLLVNRICSWALPKRYKNITITNVVKNLQWKMEEFQFDNNSLMYMDWEIDCRNNTGMFPFPFMHTLTFRSNGLEFVHPTMISCMFPHLQRLSLADNKLFVMYDRNTSVFKQLFTSLHNLKTLDLSANKLSDVSNVFTSSRAQLSHIDLSRNEITQFNMMPHVLEFLRHVDLSSNLVIGFGVTSLVNLNRIIANAESNKTRYGNVSIYLSRNPFLCFACRHYVTVNWIFTHEQYVKDFPNITCSNGKQQQVFITKSLIDDLWEDCERPKRIRRIVIGATISTASVIIVVILILVTKKVRRTRNRLKKRDIILKNITDCADGFQFVVFVSFSSMDDPFIHDSVLGPLDENIQRFTKVLRPLVCTGDEYFRFGHPIHDEMVQCMRNSAVVLIFLTDNFLHSHFCLLEFNQACQLGKPIVLMIKDRVDEEIMPPAMAVLFKTNARIHWAVNNGVPELKGSWQHVSESLLEVATHGIDT